MKTNPINKEESNNEKQKGRKDKQMIEQTKERWDDKPRVSERNNINGSETNNNIAADSYKWILKNSNDWLQ